MTTLADFDEAIDRQRHLVDFPHRLKVDYYPAFGSTSVTMNCGRDSCWLPAKDPSYFTLNESA